MNGSAPGAQAGRLCIRPAPHVLTYVWEEAAAFGPRLPRLLALRLPPLTKGAMPMSKKTASLFGNVVGLVGHRRFCIDGVGVGLLLFRSGGFGLDLLGCSDVGRLRE